MIKRICQVVHINTVTRKIAVMTMTFGVIFLLLISVMLPSIVYSVLKGYIIQPVTLSVQDAAARLNSILVSNSYIINTITDDSELEELLSSYYEFPERQAETKRIIQDDKLFHKTVGRGSTGLNEKIFNDSAIITELGDIFHDENIESVIDPLVSSDWYKNYRKTAIDGSKRYTPVFTAPDNNSYICYINTKSIDDKLFDFILIVDMTFTLSTLRQLAELDITDILLFGYNNEVLYSALEQTGFSFKFAAEDISPLYKVFVDENKEGVDFVTIVSSSKEGLKLAVNAPESVLMKPFAPLILFFALMFGACLLLLVVLICIIVKQSHRNLKTLSQLMLRLQGGDYSVRSDINSSDELEAMGLIFNIMTEKIIEHEKQEKEMQYAILISEIDPHFIYNTLNTITYLAQLGQTEDIINVNTALISMIKDRLRLKGYESFDLLINEVEVINQYLVIQNYLYGDKIKLIWKISDDLMTRRIPKNILQPLIENAILHGLLANKDAGGRILPGEITVSVYEPENSLKLIIDDNGKGMSAEVVNKYFRASQKTETVAGENIGIKNIIMRLQYLFADSWKIDVESEIGKGTSIEITFPSD